MSIMAPRIMILSKMSLSIVIFGIPTVGTKTPGRTFLTFVLSFNPARHSKFR
jgi:hypothetical protein